MGEMADMYADMATCLPDFEDGRFDDFRKDAWVMKDGKTIDIKNMTDHHVLAAFKMTGDDRLRDEMIIRLFETMIQPKIGF